MPVDLTPSEGMANAAKRSIESMPEAQTPRSVQIANGEALTATEVKELHSFFSQNIKGTDFELAGGIAGKVWAKAKLKELTNAGEIMPDEAIEFAELFFDSKEVKAEDGLIWKPVLRAGMWHSGPNGRPLKVVPGKSSDPHLVIGLQDILNNYNDGAVEHVTIPTSHDDLVDQNTGYIRKLKIGKMKDGTAALMAGHDFTEPDIKGKVERGSIANTSVGLEFGYVRKEDGKKYPIVLRHVALTNRPWINRLTPFGVKASDDSYEIESLTFSEPLEDEWAAALTHKEIHEAIESQVECEIEDIAIDRVLLKDGDKSFVASYSIENGDVVVDDRDNWTERDAPVIPEPTSDKDGILNTSKSELSEKENIMPEGDEKKEEVKTPAVESPAPTIDLSTDPAFIAQKEENARLKATLDQLAKKDRVREANDFVTGLKNLGFTEDRGCTALLKKVEAIALSDEGDATLLLSEGDEAARPVSAFSLVKEIFDAMPKGDDGKLTVQFSEQATDPLRKSAADKPPAESADDVQLSEAELNEVADAGFAELFPTEAARAAAANKE